jgi:DNA-binding CsgD family transcriptional regulator
MNTELEQLHLKSLEQMAISMEIREGSLRESTRTAKLTELFGQVLGWSQHDIETLVLAVRLRDLGNCALPSEVVNRPRSLYRSEIDLVRMHTVLGAQLLNNTGRVAQLVSSVAMHHHERWDGGGYPEGLKALDIPLFARVAALIDTFLALTSERPYRPAMSVIDALRQMRGLLGSQLDPTLGGRFIQYMDTVVSEHAGEIRLFLDLTSAMDEVTHTLKANNKSTHVRSRQPELAQSRFWSNSDVAMTLAKIHSSLRNLSPSKPTPNEQTSSLTVAEKAVLTWVQQGKTNPEIAQILGISRFTVKTHLQRIFSKTGICGRVSLAKLDLHAA